MGSMVGQAFLFVAIGGLARLGVIHSQTYTEKSHIEITLYPGNKFWIKFFFFKLRILQ